MHARTSYHNNVVSVYIAPNVLRDAGKIGVDLVNKRS
jgi:hypothetical protein